MFKLVISDDEGKTTIVPLIRDEVTIGRKEGNTIRLTDRNVSRFHARVMRDDDAFLIEDLGSLTGTKVNNMVLKGKSQAVSTGDQISIGDYSVSIRTDVASDIPLGQQIGPGEEAGIGKVTAHARLVMLTKPAPGQEFDLTAELYVMGRSGEANCRIPDASVSRAHARLDYDDGKWTISDLDSVNGIQINSQKKDDYVLKAGDVIELGTVRIRFVAPGEPYDFKPGAGDAGEPVKSVAPGKGASKNITIALGVIGLIVAVVIVGIAAMRMMSESGAPGDGDASKGAGSGKSYNQLLDEGKDAMQAEKWAECAKIFDAAIRKNSESKTAREWKRNCIMEAEAQKHADRGVEAADKGNWKDAERFLKRVPRSSRYYNDEKLKTVSGKLCEGYIAAAKSSADSQDFATVVAILEEIDKLSSAPAVCYDEVDKLWDSMDPQDGDVRELDSEAGKAAPRAARRKRGNGQKSGMKNDRTSGGTPKPDNPYAATNPYESSSVSNPYDTAPSPGKTIKITGPSEKPDPMSEAHTLIRQGNTRAAIAVLEKGGNRQSVLALLAKLYMRVNNKRGYESVAAKFIRLYPDDPRSERFKKNLGR